MRKHQVAFFVPLALSSLMAGCSPLTSSRDGGSIFGNGWQACDAERPRVCTMVYDPVCAYRNSGELADYASPCNACADVTVTVWHPESCED